MSGGLNDSDLEQVFDVVARALDAVGEHKERGFLAALVLALANKMSNIADVMDAIAVAERAAAL